MLYEQLCGHRPFTGNSVDEVVHRIAQSEPAPPSSYDPAVPRTLEAICLEALEKDPEARFQSLAAMVDALESVGGEAQLATADEVGAYVSTMFPESTDTRRQTLRRARERDPSLPRMRPGSTPMSNTPALPMAPASAEPALPSPLPLQLATPAGAPVPQAPAPRPSRRGLWSALAAAAVVAMGVGTFVLLRPPNLTPAEALTAAARTTEASERVSLLMPLAKSPAATDEHLARAAALLLESRQYEPVLDLVDVWLIRSPRSLEARLAEIQAATHAHKGRRAETAIKEASVLAPKDPRPDRALAELRELQGDGPGALEAWSHLNTKAPTSSSRARQGFWLSQLGHLDEADEVLTKALRKQSDAAVAAELGFVKFRRNQPDEALRLLRLAVKERPTLLDAHYYLATVLYQKGDVKGARAEYLEADKLAGSDPRPLAALCEMEQQQQSTQAEDARKRIRERFPAEADTMLAKCSAVAAP